MKKNINSKGIIILVVVFGVLICIITNWYNNNEYPNDTYIKMNEINDDKTLIGLSEEEVIELLGEPRYKYVDGENKNNYVYTAGSTVKKSIFGNEYGRKVYDFFIDFNESDKVEYTFIKECT